MFDMGGYVGDLTHKPKMVKIGPAGPPRQRGEMWRSNLGYFFIFFIGWCLRCCKL